MSPKNVPIPTVGYDFTKTVTRSNPLKLNGVATNIGSLNTIRTSIIEGKGFPAGDNFFNPDGNGGFFTRMYDTENAQTYDGFLYAMADVNEDAKKIQEKPQKIRLPKLKKIDG